MNLRCLGSSSLGNCYLLESDNECLIIEAGIPFKEVKKALAFDVLKIVGVLVTHCHGDHAAHAKEFVKAGFITAMSSGTAGMLNLPACGFLHPGYWYNFGGFTVTPFDVIHDAPEPLGFIVRHQDIGTLLFATDTEYIKQNFTKLKLNHILIECNYSQKIIDGRVHSGSTDKGLRDRVLQSHVELETCKGFIEVNKTVSLDTVTLLHLSDGNSNAREFTAEIQSIVGKDVVVYVADKGVTVNLDILPF